MPTWGEVLLELRRSAPPGHPPDFDSVRRRYLAHLYGITGRSLIIYYSDWLSGGHPDSAITLEDMQAMMEVCKDLPGPNLDLILHTPGGSAEAASSMVEYLRRKFDHIRVFVPLAAMSAGTMLALSADALVMGKHSQLGPIDPQMLVRDGYVPARAIVDQFDRAVQECQDPAKLNAWYPILQQYGPALLAQCEAAEQLSKRLVAEWLAKYMFRNEPNAHKLADDAAAYFGDFTTHQSHSLGISREKARAHKIVVEDLEDDQVLQDAVLTVHHATMHTLGGPAVKIAENHLGRAYVKIAQPMLVPQNIQIVQGGSPLLQFPPQ